MLIVNYSNALAHAVWLLLRSNRLKLMKARKAGKASAALAAAAGAAAPSAMGISPAPVEDHDDDSGGMCIICKCIALLLLTAVSLFNKLTLFDCC
jgi:hypothetical protein